MCRSRSSPNHGEDSHSRLFWVSILDSGAIGLTGFCLLALVVELVFAGEPYRPKDDLLLVASSLGFVLHVCTSRILIRATGNVRQSALPGTSKPMSRKRELPTDSNPSSER
jgi:hypothetical protein